MNQNISPNENAREFPERKTPRAYFHDYSGGEYFVTICTKEKKHYFGKIHDCQIVYSRLGNETVKLINDLEAHYPYMNLRQFVVMPNHIHAIIRINENIPDNLMPKCRSVLSVILGGLKQSVTMFARRNGIDFDWQKNYHDRIIRNQEECNRISEYISNNIVRWEKDYFFN